MGVENLSERIRVVDTDCVSVMKSIAEATTNEDPFCVLNIGDIVRKHNEFLRAMPRVRPYFAVKCNNHLLVLKTLAALGAGFECASKDEIKQILSMGVEPQRIVYGNPSKFSTHIAYASEKGVHMLSFDCEGELHKVKRLFPTAKLLIRIRCDDEQALRSLGSKFGCDTEVDVPRLLRLARLLELNIVGVTFHIGSGCRNPMVFRHAIKLARHVVDFAQTLGYTMTILNLGGGFPGEKGSSSIEKIGKVVNDALAEYFPEDAEHPVDVLAEPGRYYVAPSCTLACHIHSKREIKTADPNITHIMYYISDGIYGSLNNILHDDYEPKPQLLTKTINRKQYPSTIWGPTGDSMDKVLEDQLLPEMKVGEWIYFENMGAYALPVATQFDGCPLAKVHAVADQKVWRLLKDCYPLTEEYFSFEDLPKNPPFINKKESMQIR